MNIDYSKLTMDELTEIRRKVNVEITKRNQKIGIKKRFKKQKRTESIALINFISKRLGYDITDSCRKQRYTYVRFVLCNYLNENTDDTIENIMSYFNIKNHTTFYHARDTHNNLLFTENVYYMLHYDRITNLIKEFYKINVNKVA